MKVNAENIVTRITDDVLSLLCSESPAADRPNILWITTEDMSPDLGCYGDQYANTPYLDQSPLRGCDPKLTRDLVSSPVFSHP